MNNLKLYYFSQCKFFHDMYTEFTVLAESVDDAWVQIQNKAVEDCFTEKDVKINEL